MSEQPDECAEAVRLVLELQKEVQAMQADLQFEPTGGSFWAASQLSLDQDAEA